MVARGINATRVVHRCLSIVVRVAVVQVHPPCILGSIRVGSSRPEVVASVELYFAIYLITETDPAKRVRPETTKYSINF